MATPTAKEETPQSNTANKKAEEVLRQVELIVENSQDAIIGETLEGIITSWNGGAVKMFGYTAEEVIGQSMLILYPPELKTELPTLLEKVKSGEGIADHDTSKVCKDGTKIDVGISISPVKMEDGTVIGASIVERNITHRKKEEEKLRQIRLIVENSHDALIGETLEGLITSWNGGAAKMFGYSLDEMIGKPMANLSPPELQNESPELLEKVKKAEVIADYDSIWLQKDGTHTNVEFSVSPVYSEDGTITGASIVGRDITRRKKSEVRIKELNDVRSKFIEIIAHQLRTPIGAVNWNLEALLKGDFGKLDDTQYKFLLATHKSSLAITQRVGDLLTAVDIEEERVTFEKGVITLDNLVGAVVNEMAERCKLKNVSCEYVPPQPELPVIEGDNDKIRTVITKITENALMYTKEGGKIAVKLEAVGGAARFEVTDTGVGIPEPEKHSIFTRFFRASNAPTMQPDAFGLGLFISKSFIEQHGGKIGFESTEGQGSTFWFELPLR